MYKFKQQLALGQEQERRVADYYSDRFEISESTRSQQRRGIDYWFKSKKTGKVFSVEIKADFKTHQTGNVYIETVSVGRYVNDVWTVEADGWALTSQADWLMYLVVETGELYIVKPDSIRETLEEWTSSYRSVSVRNGGYQGRGLLVPLETFEQICSKTARM